MTRAIIPKTAGLVGLCSALVALLAGECVCADPLTLGIAFMVLSSSPTVNTDPFSAGFAALPSNYSDTPTALTAVQPGWVQGMQLYQSIVNANGGFPYTNSSSDVQYVKFNINYFPVAKTTDTPAVQLSKMLRFMNDTVLQQRYGPDYVMIGAPPILTGVPTADIATLANFCETYAPYCILLSPTSTDATIHICTKNPVTDLLPADCIARNRKSGRRRFYQTITTAPPSLLISDLLLQRLLVNGLQRVAIMRVPAWVTAAENAKTAALSNGQTVVFDETYNPANVSLDLGYWVDVMTRLKATNPQALLVYSGFATNESLICENVLLALQTIDYYPGAVDLAASCGGTILAANKNPDGSLTERGLRWRDDLSLYSYGVLPWDPRLSGPDYRAEPISDGVYEPFQATDTLDSPAVFNNALVRRFPVPYSGIVSAQAATAPLLLQKAVEIVAAYPWDPVALAAAMQQVAQPSHHGYLSLDVVGRRKDTPYPRVQSTGNGTSPTGALVIGTQIIIAPPLAAPIYPTPNWSERVYRPAFFANGTLETVFVAVTAVAEFLCLIVILALWKFREHKVVKAATLPFCIVMVAGCMLWMSTVFVWGLHENDGTCMGKVWTLVLGWVAINVPLALKTYRVGRIFNQQHLAKVDMPTRLLFGWLGIATLVTAVLLAIWTGSSPLTSTIVVVDPYRPALNYTVCTSSGGTGWIAFFIAAMVSLLVINGVTAFWARDIPVADFNESSKIAQVVYLNMIVAVTFIPIVYTTSDRSGALLVRSVGILGVGLVTLLWLFVTKFLEIWRPSVLYSATDGTRMAGGTPHRYTPNNNRSHGATTNPGANTVIRLNSGQSPPERGTSKGTPRGTTKGGTGAAAAMFSRPGASSADASANPNPYAVPEAHVTVQPAHLSYQTQPTQPSAATYPPTHSHSAAPSAGAVVGGGGGGSTGGGAGGGGSGARVFSGGGGSGGAAGDRPSTGSSQSVAVNGAPR